MPLQDTWKRPIADGAVAGFAEEDPDGVLPGAAAGHDRVECKGPRVANSLGDALLHAGAGRMEAADGRILILVAWAPNIALRPSRPCILLRRAGA